MSLFTREKPELFIDELSDVKKIGQLEDGPIDYVFKKETGIFLPEVAPSSITHTLTSIGTGESLVFDTLSCKSLTFGPGVTGFLKDNVISIEDEEPISLINTVDKIIYSDFDDLSAQGYTFVAGTESPRIEKIVRQQPLKLFNFLINLTASIKVTKTITDDEYIKLLNNGGYFSFGYIKVVHGEMHILFDNGLFRYDCRIRLQKSITDIKGNSVIQTFVNGSTSNVDLIGNDRYHYIGLNIRGEGAKLGEIYINGKFITSAPPLPSTGREYSLTCLPNSGLADIRFSESGFIIYDTQKVIDFPLELKKTSIVLPNGISNFTIRPFFSELNKASDKIIIVTNVGGFGEVTFNNDLDNNIFFNNNDSLTIPFDKNGDAIILQSINDSKYRKIPGTNNIHFYTLINAKLRTREIGQLVFNTNISFVPQANFIQIFFTFIDINIIYNESYLGGSNSLKLLSILDIPTGELKRNQVLRQKEVWIFYYTYTNKISTDSIEFMSKLGDDISSYTLLSSSESGVFKIQHIIINDVLSNLRLETSIKPVDTFNVTLNKVKRLSSYPTL